MRQVRSFSLRVPWAGPEMPPGDGCAPGAAIRLSKNREQAPGELQSPGSGPFFGSCTWRCLNAWPENMDLTPLQ